MITYTIKNIKINIEKKKVKNINIKVHPDMQVYVSCPRRVDIEYVKKIVLNKLDCIQIKELTTSGRVKTIKFGNKEIAGTEARTILGLKSTNFTFSIDGDNVTFSVTGYGHGVGMSQTGADALAKSGSTFEEIIKHFYTNVEIVELNSL